MAKVKVVLNRQGVRSLLRSPEMGRICREHAENVKRRCGEGYEADSYVGINRVNSAVYPATAHAVNSNAKYGTLLKAVRT